MSNPHDIDWTAAVGAAQAGFWASYAGIQRHEDIAGALRAHVRATVDSVLAFLASVSEGAGSAASAADTGLPAAILDYARIVTETVDRIDSDFGAEVRMMSPNGTAPWPLIRDRWFAVAEAEVIRTLRSEAFLDVQARLLGAAGTWLGRQTPETLTAVHAMLSLPGAAQRGVLDQAVTGVAIADTPRRAVWRAGGTTLWRYDGEGRTDLPPVLLCYGMIGTPGLTDLQPDRSLVRRLLAAGLTVLSLDWGKQAAGDPFTTIANAIAAATAETGASRLVLMGICHGGILAAAHTARRPRDVAGLILAITPIDFHADKLETDPAKGLINLWMRSIPRETLERLLQGLDPVPGMLLGTLFSSINPVRTVRRYGVELPEALASPVTRDLVLATETWLADRPDLPGTEARRLALDLYHDNALVRGAFRVGDSPVSLADIDVPVLNLIAADDHIVPPPSARALRDHVDPARYTEQTLPAGHAGLFIGTRTQPLLAPAILRWITDHGTVG